MSLRGAVYRAMTGLRDLRDRVLYPEAPDAAGHWQRVAMNHAADARIEELDPTTHTAVEISGAVHAGRDWKEYVVLDYPEFDICAPLTEKRRFDVVICEQVLEHVEDPWAAAENLRGLCAPDGLVVVSTPFLVKVHELPELGMYDYWRFTRVVFGCCSSAQASRSSLWRPGATARRWWGTSAPGPRAASGIRCATSRTCHCRSGLSLGTERTRRLRRRVRHGPCRGSPAPAGRSGGPSAESAAPRDGRRDSRRAERPGSPPPSRGSPP